MKRDELDELVEQMSAEERARRLERRKTFQLGIANMSMIVNTLLADDDAKLGRIVRDLVNFNATGEMSLIENGNKKDKIDMAVRELLYNDCTNLVNAYLRQVVQNSLNRQGISKPNAVEEGEAPTSQENESGIPSVDDVVKAAIDEWGNGASRLTNDKVKELATRWREQTMKNHWRDDRGEPIQHWKPLLSAYIDRVWRG